MSFDVLKDKLADYLESQSINSKKKFLCIDPKHKEKTPSSVLYGSQIVKCFGCGKVSDIFEAAHLLEGLPSRTSPNFFKGNVLELARRFGIKLGNNFDESGYDIYNSIMEIIRLFAEQSAANKGIDVLEEVVSWAPELYRKLQEEYFLKKGLFLFAKTPPLYLLKQQLFEKGYTELDLNKYGIVKYIFETDFMQYLFPLYQKNGFCIGFIKRQVDGYDPKYLNTPNNPTFVKENYLYGTFFERKTEDLFIVEGQKDVLAFQDQNHDAFGISFSSITNLQFQYLIRDVGTKRYILSLDNDPAGREGIKKGIKLFLSENILPYVYVPTNKDVDEDYSKNIFVDKSKIMTGVEFFLNQYEDFDDPALHREIIQLLASVKSAVSRASFTSLFAEQLGIKASLLEEDVNNLLEVQRQNKEIKIQNIYKNALEKIIEHPDDHIKIIEDAKIAVSSMIKTNKTFDNNSLLELIEKSFSGLNLSKADEDFQFREKGLGFLSEAMSVDGLGWTTTGGFVLVPGHSHTGKTLLITQAIAETLLCNNDSMVFLFSTDDALDLIIPRIVSSIIGHPNYKIGYFYQESQLPESMREIKSKALNLLYRFVKEERLIAKDLSYCTTFKEFSSLVEFYMEKYPNRKPIVFNDNFHRNGDYRDKDDLKKVELSAADIKTFSVSNSLSVWCSVEKRKGNNMFSDPGLTFNSSNDDILGAGALVYYATHIIHTVNDYIQRGKDIDSCVWVHEYQGQLLPQTQVRITKSKSNGLLKNFVCNMYPSANLIVETDYDQAYSIATQRAKQLGYIK